MAPRLFSRFKLRRIEFKNRIFVSPMCQYSSTDGMPTDWHLVHLGSRAVGGASLVLTEAAAVSPEGRISPWDLGIWSDTQAESLRRVTDFILAQEAIPGIQLAHAGRKASCEAPFRGGAPIAVEQGGWRPLAPSSLPFGSSSPVPREMRAKDLDETVGQFAEAARRGLNAGFKVVELHMAHGYLLHEFLSPLSNQREDAYGGSLENRMRFPLQVAQAVRKVLGADPPLFVRISCSDWLKGGWDLSQSIIFSTRLKGVGVDLIDCSSGGLAAAADIPVGPGYQTPFASAIRSRAAIATGTVGLITDPVQAEQIVATDQADAVIMARELLRDPYWPLRAARELGAEIEWPPQYLRAKLG